jgi:hypothetical protein
MLPVLFLTLVMIAVIWELAGFITGYQAAESPKQLLSVLFLCWVVLFCFASRRMMTTGHIK